METYQCQHCWRHVPYDEGAYDDVERMIGPICDDCACIAFRLLEGAKPTLPLEFTIHDAIAAAHQPKEDP